MIRGLIETSLIDWDGMITMVLFCDVCNLNCPFCQNWQLLNEPDAHAVIPWKTIESIIKAKSKWLDGVVLTGGEPLVCASETNALCERIKRLGKRVKLDTNGTVPGALQRLVSQRMVDYVAMDIKAPLDERYAVAAGIDLPVDAVRESICLLMKSDIAYEFRTTCVPGIIDETSLHAIGAAIHGAEKWALQTYVPAHARDESYRAALPRGYHDAVHTYLAIAKQYVRGSCLRGQSRTALL